MARGPVARSSVVTGLKALPLRKGTPPSGVSGRCAWGPPRSAQGNRGQGGGMCKRPGSLGEPRELLIAEQFAGRRQLGCALERADVKMHFARKLPVAAGKRRATRREKTPLDAGRRLILGDCPRKHCDLLVGKRHENRSRCAAVPTAAVAMTPKRPSRLAFGPKGDCAAKTATVEDLVHRFTHLLSAACPALLSLLGSPREETPPSRWKAASL